MLVLNTNEGNENLLGKMSNSEFVSSYPDFGQILLMPAGMLDSKTQTDGLISIYGIPVHSYSVDLFKNQFNNGTIGTSATIGSLAGVSKGGNQLSAYQVYGRYATKFKLKGGEVVGKNIYGICFLKCEASGGYSMGYNRATLTVYLIHSDGTMTSIGTQTTSNRENLDWNHYYYDYDEYRGNQFKEFNITTSGTVAQEGDVLMAEIMLDHISGVNSTFTTILGFGYTGGGRMQREIARPIQISIE